MKVLGFNGILSLWKGCEVPENCHLFPCSSFAQSWHLASWKRRWGLI